MALSKRHALDMVYNRIVLGGVNDSGVVVDTPQACISFAGVPIRVRAEETNGSTILMNDQHVRVVEPAQAQQIWDLKPSDTDTIDIDGVTHSVVSFRPMRWRGKLESIDFVVRTTSGI